MQNNTQLYNRPITVLLLFSLLLCNTLQAQKQKKDSLRTFRDFVLISNGYKQYPLYLNMEMKNTTNYILSPADTATTDALFCLGEQNSYVRVGEFEQVVNDSMALLVSDRLRQMILYTDAGAVVASMKNMMGVSFPDSSIRSMADKYTAIEKGRSGSFSSIELRSRAFIHNTTLPKEVIEMKYHLQSKQPMEVITLKRTMIPVDSLQFSHLSDEPGLTDKLFMLEGSYFLLKEQVTTFLYKTIDRSAAARIPVAIHDRVQKLEEGQYRPVQKYETYTLMLQ